MITIIKYLIKEKLVVSLIVGLIVMLGLMSAKQLNREAFPEVNFDMVSIKTVYPGGSPDELESLITIPIEKKLREVDGIDKVRSYNIENVSVIAIYLDEKVTDKKQVVQDIKDAVGLVEDLPATAEDPVVEEIKIDKTEIFHAVIVAADENVPYNVMRSAGDKLEDFFYDFDGVAQVQKFGFYDREFLIEVDPGKLAQYRLGMNNVINTLSARNIDLPGGPLRVGDDEFILRTKGQYNNINEILNTVIRSNDGGYSIRIRDIATVKDTVDEPDILERYQGKKSIIFKVLKKRSADEIRLTDRIMGDMNKFVNPNPDQISIEFFNITSEFTRDTIDSVVTNAITGFILLAFILFLMLGVRMASIVTATIPLVFMVAVIGIKSAGVTINVISLFGMIMVLGMIVDFGIVISENFHRYMEMGFEKKDAIVKGVSELFWPVTVTFLCISAAFMPLMLLTGIMGKFIKYIPMVVMICLTASWFTALFIMPTFLNIFTRNKHGNRNGLKTVVLEDGEHLERGLFGRIQIKYMRLLKMALRHRYITVGLIFMLLIGALALIPVVGFVFSPGGGSENIEVKTYLPNSRNLQANLRDIKEIEKIIQTLPENELETIHSRVGTEAASGLDPKPGDGTHKSTISIYLTPEKDRSRTADEIQIQLRKDFADAQDRGLISKENRINVKIQEHGPPVGDPVNVEIRGDDFAELNRIADEYTAYLKGIDGVYDIKTDFEEGKTEFRYKTDEVLASRAKVSVRDVATAINASFEGVKATTVRDGEDEIGLRVRFNEAARKKMRSLNDVMISNNQDGLIPLGMITSRHEQPGYSQISRLDYKRIVQVKGNLDLTKINSVKVNSDLALKFADIEKRYPGYYVSYGGEQEETSESMAELGRYFQIALIVIFIILAIFFKSLMTPVVVMSAIPFSLIGVIFAVFLHNEPLSFMSVLAIFSLAGVIVSNTVTLVEFINNKRADNHGLVASLTEAAALRLRPIILTTGTTVLGLFPSIYGIGEKNHMTAPLALAFGYGLIFATVITLILVPCFYHVAEDIKGKTSAILSRFGISMSPTIYQAVPAAVSVQDHIVEAVEELPVKKSKKNKI
jgi:multidrug efflux pump subunit AcrB